MAIKGTAGKSASGASMSKYDVEVESRLQALEKAVKELQSHTHSGGGGGDWSSQLRGGGGGPRNNGSNQNNSRSNRGGNGNVSIQFI